MEDTEGELHCYGHKSKRRKMTWHNDPHDDKDTHITTPSSKDIETRTIVCPSCGHCMEIHDKAGLNDLPGLPAGVRFDPNDQEILEHLEAKVLSNIHKLHPLIDEFIPTLEGENGICYTHPEKLPGVSKDGLIRHFFHRPSKAYTTGTRKRRKVNTDEDGGETRWHKTGKTRPVLAGKEVKGFKKILVLYTNYGRQRKPEKTSWVMHQYHLGNDEEEKDGELVVSKVFYQTQPRHCNSLVKEPMDRISKSRVGHEYGSSLIKDTTLVDYYNPSFVSYSILSHNRESSPQLIPNLEVHGGGSSFIRLSTDVGKGKLDE